VVYIQKEVPMLENLLEYYRKSDDAKEGGGETDKSCNQFTKHLLSNLL
jgi:hypothetical protein